MVIKAVNSATLVSDDSLISIIQENKDLLILFGNLLKKIFFLKK